MNIIVRCIASLILLGWKCCRRLCMVAVKTLFKRCGSRVILHPFDTFSYGSIVIGNNVFIGRGAFFSASRSAITIGNSVMIGPRVTMMGGDHNISQVGRLMADVRDKRPSDDAPILIEDDVWIGAGVIILKGVTIARGSVIAAGSVVTKSIPEFSIAGGVPCKVIKPRFSVEELARHKFELNLRG